MILLRRLWKLEGTVDRATYLSAGLIGFALKYALDWTIASLVYGRTWSPLSYWRLVRLSGSSTPDLSISMFVLLLSVSLPFLWFGMAMTLLRLRDAGRNAGWAACFFVPVLNIFLFGTLCILPPRAARGRDLSGAMESALFAVTGIAALGTVAIGFGTRVLQTYGIGLFFAVPFSVGYLSALLHGRRHPTAAARPYLTATLSLILLSGFLLAVAWEGVLCLVMAFPLALVAAMLGAFLGERSAGRRNLDDRSRTPTFMALAVPPLLLLVEATFPLPAPIYRVDSSIVIHAPIERVWTNVVSFSEITEAPEWYFRAGIAYPLRARITGSGVGAVRYCEFTTGSFVEPIEVWQEPQLLRFSVSSSPKPMRELSPYENIVAPHLEGFLVSRGGQFALYPLSAETTRLVGTTWYQHNLQPGPYWTIWSDAIIHRIHLRVLRHVKQLSERRATKS